MIFMTNDNVCSNVIFWSWNLTFVQSLAVLHGCITGCESVIFSMVYDLLLTACLIINLFLYNINIPVCATAIVIIITTCFAFSFVAGGWNCQSLGKLIFLV